MATPRFGLETEMHSFTLTFKRSDSEEVIFWKAPPNLGPNNTPKLDTTMIGAFPILVPLDDTTYKPAGQPDTNVIWAADWGLRAVGDAFGTETVYRIVPKISPTELQPFTLGKCTVELQTAAQEVTNVDYWVFARRCIQTFRNTMTNFSSATFPLDSDLVVASPKIDRWFPLDDFVAAYNATVDAIQAPNGFQRNKFKFRVSDRLQSLAAGTAPGEGGTHWTPLVAIARGFDTITRPADAAHPQPWGYPVPSGAPIMYCDVQLTYDTDLESLWTNMANWQNMWASTWLVQFRDGDINARLDAPNGLERWKNVPTNDIYSTQTYKALWSTARIAATSYVSTLDMTNLPANGTGQPILKALIAYLFVGGAVNYQVGNTSTAKNYFPQLPKTSPASIARALSAMFPLFTPVLQALSTQTNTDRAATVWSQNAAMVRQPAQLAPDGPCQGAVAYADRDGNLLVKPIGSLNPFFRDMWTGTFDIAGTAAAYALPASKNGFSSDPPFRVPWANNTQSSKAAARTPDGNGMGLKILLESRYSSSKLNQGFNAYATDAMFKQSYLSLVNVLSPGTLANATNTVNAYFPGAGPPLAQVFPARAAGGQYVH